MKYKFKPGDVVFVAKCTDDVNDMQHYVNTQATIKEQTSGYWENDKGEGERFPAYLFEEDKRNWFWREDWLELVSSPVEFDVSENDFMSILGD